MSNNPKRTFVQLFVAGTCYDVSVETWQMIKDELHTEKMIEAEDIYGAKLELFGHMIESARTFTQESAERYKESHTDCEGDCWAP